VLVITSPANISSLVEQTKHFLGSDYSVAAYTNKKAAWPQDAHIVIASTTTEDSEDLLNFDPDWVAHFPSSAGDHADKLPLSAIAAEWPHATLFCQISPRLVKGKTPEETVSQVNWNQCNGVMDDAIEFLSGDRLLRNMRSYTVFTTKFKDRKVPEYGYSDWLRVAGMNTDLIPEKGYTHRIWREKYMEVPCNVPYGEIDEERAREVRNNRAHMKGPEQSAWKQRKAIEDFERICGCTMYDALNDWVLNNKLPTGAPVDDVIEAYHNLRRGNWVKDKIQPLVHPIVMGNKRTLVIANSRPVIQEARNALGVHQILDGSLAETDTRVQATLANFRDSRTFKEQKFGRAGTAHTLIINFDFAEQEDVLKLADQAYWLEYPTNYMQFENIRSAAEKVGLPLIFTHLKGTWEDSLLSVLLERDYTS
jgi:hypothetical protein